MIGLAPFGRAGVAVGSIVRFHASPDEWFVVRLLGEGSAEGELVIDDQPSSGILIHFPLDAVFVAYRYLD